MKGYAKGVRFGHASGELTEPVLEAIEEWHHGRIKHWSDFFESKKAARKHVGKLWHCTDIISGMWDGVISDMFDRRAGTMGQLARLMLNDLRRS